jgi:hypothetical protein
MESVKYFNNYYNNPIDELSDIEKYEIIRNMRIKEKIYSVFKGKEDIFMDPFALGLEPSISPYSSDHFEDILLNEIDEYKKNNKKKIGLDNRNFDLVNSESKKSNDSNVVNSKLFDFLKNKRF